MDLKKRASGIWNSQTSKLSLGASRCTDQLLLWAKGPGPQKVSAQRVGIIALAFVFWCAAWAESIPGTFLITLAGGFSLLLWFGHQEATRDCHEEIVSEPERNAPGEELVDPAGGQVAEGDDFWSLHQPVNLSKKPAPVAESDGEGVVSASVPVSSVSPEPTALFEKEQVADVGHALSRGGTPSGAEWDTGKIAHDGISLTFPVSHAIEAGQDTDSKIEATPVSHAWDTSASQATRTTTDSNYRPDKEEDWRESRIEVTAPIELEDMYLALYESDQNRHSYRNLAREFGRSSSTVHRMISRARRRREEAARTKRPVLPGILDGEDGPAKLVRFTPEASYGHPDQVVQYINDVFMGETEPHDGGWELDTTTGVIVGFLPDRNIRFSGCWSETGVVVITELSVQ